MIGSIAAYPIRYAVIVHDALLSSLIPTFISISNSGSIVTITVWSSAAIKTPKSNGNKYM